MLNDVPGVGDLILYPGCPTTLTPGARVRNLWFVSQPITGPKIKPYVVIIQAFPDYETLRVDAEYLMSSATLVSSFGGQRG